VFLLWSPNNLKQNNIVVVVVIVIFVVVSAGAALLQHRVCFTLFKSVFLVKWRLFFF
jgi:hypothetical protein